jgi:hypothetical protein
MATNAQINANRRNAKKSTGPQTDQGKAASSQNAFKHGLFAREAVIRGEDPAEFDLYREAFLADLKPVGPMESMLAERIVSLSWRLLRAERLQNQAIDAKILESAGGSVAKVTRSLLPAGVRRTLADSGVMEPDPSLGRIFAKDSLDAWLLDRLQLYERRIETSMFRTIAQLRQFQRRRQAEQARAEAQRRGDESPPPQRHSSNLKKRTQFGPAQPGIDPCLRGAYDRMDHLAEAGNEPNQSWPEHSQTGQFAEAPGCTTSDMGSGTSRAGSDVALAGPSNRPIRL